MWKRQLRQSNVNSVENISRGNNNRKTRAKRSTYFFWFLFGDFNISNIFYKILNLNKCQLVLIITHWTYTCLNPWASIRGVSGHLRSLNAANNFQMSSMFSSDNECSSNHQLYADKVLHCIFLNQISPILLFSDTLDSPVWFNSKRKLFFNWSGLAGAVLQSTH